MWLSFWQEQNNDNVNDDHDHGDDHYNGDDHDVVAATAAAADDDAV